MTSSEETTGIVLILVVIALLYIGHNFLGNIKAAPITLIPQSTATAQVQDATAGTALAVTQGGQQAVAMQMQQQNNAYSALGNGLGALIAGISNSAYPDDMTY